MTRAAFLAIATVLAVTPAVFAAHPQDGPHADLRVAIEDEHVRFSVGINLVFLDEIIEVPREARDQVSDAEADLVLESFRGVLTEEAACSINGIVIEPAFERLDIFTKPDPGMIAIFEKTGARGLIRATAVMRFDADERTEQVEMTWPAYPIDRLAEQMEAPGAVRPRMYFEAVFTAGGKSSPARFTHAEPTIRWSRDASAASDPLRDLPSPAITVEREGGPYITAALGLAAIAMLGLAATRRTNRSRAIGVASAVLLGAGALAMQAHLAARAQRERMPLVTNEQAEQILVALHESLYRAFDYTAESDIYDSLGMALDGDLLGELYEQIRLSLLQAEEEMKIGIVTGLDPIETSIDHVDASGPDPVGLGFDAVHRWRVDGTVYHWGHSHTRSHIYEAGYRVTFTDAGWRITGHELRSQQRIEPEISTPADEVDPVQRTLELLGRPDI